METITLPLVLMCLILSGVFMLFLGWLKHARAITREQNENWRLNGELMGSLMYGFDLFMSHVDVRGFELDESAVKQITDSNAHVHYELLHDRLPSLSPNHFYYWHSPKTQLTSVIYKTADGEIRFICKSKVGPHAYSINSNYQYDPNKADQVPFNRYPSSFGGLVGLVSELNETLQRLQIGRVPLPATSNLAL